MTPSSAGDGGVSLSLSAASPASDAVPESPQLSARRLVEAHKSGDPEAFQAIVRNYYPQLYAQAFRSLGDHYAAEDAVQEALVRAYRALARFDGDYYLGAWLHRIVTNVCVDEGNRRRRADVAHLRLSSRREVTASVEERAAGPVDDVQIVRDAVDRLPANYREVLILRDVLDLGYADVASRTGISEQNARARVHRARAALRQLVSASTLTGATVVAFVRRGVRGGLETAQQVAPNVSQMSPEVMTVPARIAPAATSLIAVAAVSVAVGLPALTGAMSSPAPPTRNTVQIQTGAADGSLAPAALPTTVVVVAPTVAPTTIPTTPSTTTVAPRSTWVAPVVPGPAMSIPSAELVSDGLHVASSGDIDNVSGPIVIDLGGTSLEGSLDADVQLASGTDGNGSCDGTISASVSWPLAGGGTESLSFAAVALGHAGQTAKGGVFTITGNGSGSTSSSTGYVGELHLLGDLAFSVNGSSASLKAGMANGHSNSPSTCQPS